MLTRSQFLFCTAVAISAGLACADEARLRYTFPTDPVGYRLVLKSENEMSGAFFGPKGMKGGLAAAELCEFRKVGADGESSRVEMRFKAIKFRQDTPGGKSLYFDTSSTEFRDAKPDEMDAMAKMMHEVIDKPILLTIDARGEVTRIENTKPIREAVKAAGSGDQLGEATIEGMLKDDRLTRSLGALFVPLPEKPVKKGATWTSSATETEQLIGTIKRDTSWTYVADETVGKASVAHLKGEGTVQAVEDKEKLAKRPPGSKMEIDQKEAKVSTDVLFDPKAGLVQSVTSESIMPIAMSFNAENQAMAMKMRFNSTNSATLVGAGAPLDPDGVVTRPDAEATRRSTSTRLTPLPKDAPKDH
jgi:hypothetical protein